MRTIFTPGPSSTDKHMRGIEVLPNDVGEFEYPARFLYVGSIGSLHAEKLDGTIVEIPDAIGEISGPFTKVFSTGTTAGNIQAFN